MRILQKKAPEGAFWKTLVDLDSLVHVEVDNGEVPVAESPEEVLCALGDSLAVHDEADFKAGYVHACADEAALFRAHVPGEIEVVFVSEAVLGAIRLENIVVTGNLTIVAVDEMSEARVINRLVAEFGFVGHGFGDGLDVFGCTVRVVVQVVFVQ